jgi:hypothetical protein
LGIRLSYYHVQADTFVAEKSQWLHSLLTSPIELIPLTLARYEDIFV